MPHYEHVFLARPEMSKGQHETLTKRYSEYIESEGGSVGRTEYWGLRVLAYRMGKQRKAHYLHMNISGPTTLIQGLEQQQRLDEDIIRSLSVRVDELEEGPSAMARRRDRDDRRDDRRGGGN